MGAACGFDVGTARERPQRDDTMPAPVVFGFSSGRARLIRQCVHLWIKSGLELVQEHKNHGFTSIVTVQVRWIRNPLYWKETGGPHTNVLLRV